MPKSPAGMGKSGAQRQREYRSRRKETDSIYFVVNLQARELHRALMEADKAGIAIAGYIPSGEPVETLRHLAEYYLAESQAARMEEFAMRAGNNKAAALRKRRAAA